jgi:hypothetical protein
MKLQNYPSQCFLNQTLNFGTPIINELNSWHSRLENTLKEFFIKMLLLVEIQFDYKFIMPKLFYGKIIPCPIKRSSQKSWIATTKYYRLKHLNFMSILWYIYFYLVELQQAIIFSFHVVCFWNCRIFIFNVIWNEVNMWYKDTL